MRFRTAAFLLLAALMLSGCGTIPRTAEPSPIALAPAKTIPKAEAVVVKPESAPEFIAPISDATSRVTKKPFGLLVSRKTSPVQPERFSGYHCGVDFETTAAEQDVDVPIVAACSGTLLVKKRATGYGGVAVQSCVLGGKDVTVVYGHLRLESIAAAIGSIITQGEHIGMLGKGFSTETDGERKHLHLGVHMGTAVDIRGYVQTEAALSAWIDARTSIAK